MAYQPVQLPTVNPMGQAIDLFQRIRAAKQTQEYQRQQLAIQKQAEDRLAANADRQYELNKSAQERQDKRLDLETQWKREAHELAQREEYAKALQEYDRLDRAGLPLAGQRYLLNRGIKLTPDGKPVDPFAPQAQQPTGAAPAAPTQPPQGGSPVPDQIEFGQPQAAAVPGLGPVPQAAMASPRGALPDDEAGPEDFPAIIAAQAAAAPPPVEDQGGALMPTDIPEATPTPQQPTNPILAASQAQNAARAQRFRATGPQGQDLGVIDPGEYQQAAQLKAQEFAQQFQGVPEVQQYVPVITGLIAGGHVDPAKAGELMLGMIKSDKATEQAAALAGARLRQSDLNNRRTAGAIAAGKGAQIELSRDAAVRSDLSALRRDFADFETKLPVVQTAKDMRRLRTIANNINSGNSMLQREAAESLVSIAKGGGQVTKASQDLLLNHLAGSVGDVQTWLAHRKTGQFGDMELNVLKDAANSLLQENRENVARLKGSFRSRFFTPELAPYAPFVESQYNELFKYLDDEGKPEAAPAVAAPNPEETPVLGGRYVTRARERERHGNASRAGKVKNGGKPDKVDEMLEALK